MCVCICPAPESVGPQGSKRRRRQNDKPRGYREDRTETYPARELAVAGASCGTRRSLSDRETVDSDLKRTVSSFLSRLGRGLHAERGILRQVERHQTRVVARDLSRRRGGVQKLCIALWEDSTGEFPKGGLLIRHLSRNFKELFYFNCTLEQLV